MATDICKTGNFCWINILTPEPTEAMEFFARVLGWTYYEMPGMGHGMQVDGRNIGGIFDIHGPNCPPDLKPVIGVMVKVENADATAERVLALGGRAKPAFDIGDQGRMAVCHDPIGGAFDIWEARKMPGSDADRTRQGAPSWAELMTSDVGQATEFYGQLFGWTAEAVPTPGVAYTMFKNEGTGIAGMMAIAPEMGDIPPHWGTYFTVDDADVAAQVAEGLGARVFIPPMDIQGVGRFCGILSPQGVRFYAIRYLPRQAA